MTDSPKPAPGPVALTPQQSAVAAQLRIRCQQRLEGLVRGLFDRLQDIVYEWADGLADAEQKPFLDVALTGRRQRAELEAAFARRVAAGFDALQPADPKAGAAGIDFSSLSLVAHDDMDLTVTLDSMVARARLKYAAPLGLLRRRYAYVLPKIEISERNMPLDPGVIAGAFKAAVEPLQADVQEKIILLRAFQAQVLDYLGSLLEEANEAFVAGNVLPDLKVAAPPADPKKPKAAAPKPADKPEIRSANPEEIFSFLQGLVGQGAAGAGAGPGGVIPGAQYHGGQFVGGGGIGALPASVVGGSVAAVPIAPLHIAPTATVMPVATPELVTLLSQIQAFQPKAPLAEDDQSPSVEEIRSSIRDNLRSDDEAVETIKRNDEDVINLVSMLFDFILDDDDLPTAMKALIGRLQIPLLKVAIIDRTFFNAETHSARRLLNLLAKAGIGWSSRDPGGDALYQRIEGVVLRILNDFSDDLSLFDELFEDFNAFFEQQQKREEVVDKRTRETEEGRARAELARAMVQQTLTRRMAGKQLPPVAVRLLQEAWRNVLYINCLKEGTESESWKQAVKVVDAVIWSVLPQPGADWAARLQGLAPKLANSLKKGLAGVHYDSLATEAMLRELAEVQAGFLKGQAPHLIAVVDPRSAPAQPQPGQVDVAAIAQGAAADVAAVVLPEAEAGPVVVESLPEDSEFVVRVGRLNVGCWIEFIEGEKVERHKLVARIRTLDKLIFANRRGVKVAEMAGMKLALDLSIGRARIVEEAQFIDRALESMIGSLRDLGSKTPALQGASA